MENNYANKRKNAKAWMADRRAAFAAGIEKENPGYLEENLKLRTIVSILTGVYILYGLFNIYLGILFDIGVYQGVVMIFQSLFFLLWFTLMLNSGKFVAIILLCLRLYSMKLAWDSFWEAASYAPFIMIVTFLIPIVIDLAVVLFCVYILLNAQASKTIRLNASMNRELISGRVNSKESEQMAAYHNEYGDEDNGKESKGAGEDETDFT